MPTSHRRPANKHSKRKTNRRKTQHRLLNGMLLLFALVFFDVGSSAFSAAIEWVFELFCRIVGL